MLPSPRWLVCKSLFSLADKDRLPCLYGGKIHLHGTRFDLDECTICSCDNATTFCSTRTCPITDCRDPIIGIDACCGACVVTVTDIKLTVRPTTLLNGALNLLPIDVTIDFNAEESSSISGTELWQVGVWGSPLSTGKEKKESYTKQVLDESLQSQTLSKGDSLRFQQVLFEFDLRESSCNDIPYVCVEFGRSESASAEFNLLAQEEKSLTTCVKINFCEVHLHLKVI
ncbi:uncharacterized protein [Antedon mediterranea]|uniref:uncharacterized protein n=1 Tax=Antedon mediterranea TaxID=105859 RepID=UPI003AF6A20D